MAKRKAKKIVVIGGGTGSFVLLSGLKQYPVDLTAIVPVTDDGGSTGRLRDEFGFLPVGDMRQCLAALAADNGKLRRLLLYRFDKGKGLAGHNLGNLILTALEDISGSQPEAVGEAASIFRLRGRIYPVSKKLVKLVAEYSSGKKIVSEYKIEKNHLKQGETITKLYTQPATRLNDLADKAIRTADMIVLAPGDLYDSIIANLVIGGMKRALEKSKAKLVYTVNLMTLNSQTHGFPASKHVQEIEKYTGKKVDAILLNSQPIKESIAKAYRKEKEFPVEDDLGKDKRVIRIPLLSSSIFKKPKSDSIKRSLLRHDPVKLARAIIKLV